MAPKRRTKRKTVAGAAAQPHTSKHTGDGPGTGATGGPGPSKRKRKTNSDPEPLAPSLIRDQIASIKEEIDSTENVEDLCRIQQEWLQMRQHIQLKIHLRRVFLASLRFKDELQLRIINKERPHPLMNEVILKRLATFLTSRELPTCRLVCTKWNQVMTAQMKKVYWARLSVVPTEPNDAEYQLHQTFKQFLSDMGPESALFPINQFTLWLNKIPPTVGKFFRIYSEHIKSLELSPRGTTTAANDEERAMSMSAFQKFLLPAIPNCESLSLTDVTCQVYAHEIVNLPKLNLKYLNIEMICKCDHDENRHFLTSSTFLTKMIMQSQQLETFSFYLNSMNFSEINLRRVVTMLLSYAHLDRLKNLTLRSEKLVQFNWEEAQPQNFQLKKLELGQVLISPLYSFLEHHARTLESFTVDVNQDKWEDIRRDFVGQVYSAPKLKKLRTLSVMCLEDYEENLTGFLKPEILPELTKLTLCGVNDAFIHAHAANRNGNNDSDSGSDGEDEAGYENQIQVKSLEVDLDDQDSPSDYNFLRHTFYGVQHLVLTTCQSRFITPLWTSGFPLKTLELRVTYEDHKNANASDEFYIQHLDTIITGFSVNDCERVYQHIQRTIHSPGGFQLATFNVDYFESLCKDKEYSSIRNFNRLQKLVVVCSRSSSRLTEVTFTILLLWLKSLTAISISNCCISQTFVKSIREQLPAGFFLDIVGVDLADCR